jgi:hypothetical protein
MVGDWDGLEKMKKFLATYDPGGIPEIRLRGMSVQIGKRLKIGKRRDQKSVAGAPLEKAAVRAGQKGDALIVFRNTTVISIERP